MKKKLIFTFLCIGVFLFTGCFKRDDLENVQITTTSYPIQYIVERLYGEYSTIESIYPREVDINNYELTDKQIRDFSDSSLYIFNGLSNEKDYVVPLFDYNKNIKIIDTSQSMEYTNDVEELWLDPSNFLMLTKNVKDGLQEYITDRYLQNYIDEQYETLKVEASTLDANLKTIAESSSNNTIVVSSDLFRFLEKYDYTVISLEENDQLTDKTVVDVENLIENGEIDYIFLKEGEEMNQTIQTLVDETGVETLTLKTLSNISEEDSNNHEDYITIMNQNMDLLKQEVYDE